MPSRCSLPSALGVQSLKTYLFCFCRPTAHLFLRDDEREAWTWRRQRQWRNPAQIKHRGPGGRSGEGDSKSAAWARTLAEKRYFGLPPFASYLKLSLMFFCFTVRIQVSSSALQFWELRVALWWMLDGRTNPPVERLTQWRMECTTLVSRLICESSILARMMTSTIKIFLSAAA